VLLCGLSLAFSFSRTVCFFTETFRTPLKTSAEFDEACISDSINFMSEDEEIVAINGLRSFYNATGVQPYVVCHAYDENVSSNKVGMEEYAKDWYKYQVKNEDSFVCMYFAGKSEDEAGTLVHACGENAKSVIDDNALNIFYKNIDANWSPSVSIGEMFSNAFNSTAHKIMYSIWDNIVLLIVGLFGAVLSVAMLLFLKYKAIK
jgi:hypothetical protein